MTTLTVTAKGQVTLKRDLLQHLGVEPGQQIEIEKLPDGRIEVHAARATQSIEGFLGVLAGKSSKVATVEELSEAVAGAWAGQK